jgi:hypothetical protein
VTLPAGNATIGGVMEKKTPANNGTCPFVTQHAADVIGVL